MIRLLAAVAIFQLALSPDFAAELRVLSAGAVEPGVEAFAHQVRHELGHALQVQFNTAPQIAKRLGDGEAYDILISPPAVVAQAIRDGKAVADSRVALGKVGAGMHVRADVAMPKIATVEDLKQALLGADSVVYNTASTGIYLDGLFQKMGILEALRVKTTRYASGAAVMEHVLKGRGNEIGFGAITEIRLYESRGLQYLGPLPAEVQNYTNYEAVLMNTAANNDAAKAVLKLLAMPTTKALFAAKGIE